MLNNMGARVDDKLALVQKCKFTIAFENESENGYCTEKLIQPLLNGSIPIYWGDPSAREDFNPDCFIDVHRFNSYEEVVDHVLEVDRSDALWERYVSAPIFPAGKVPAKLSDQAILGFFDSIFKERKAQISRWRKTRQRYYRRLKQSQIALAAAGRYQSLQDRVRRKVAQ